MIHQLVDFDSDIPNLALMKISAWAKSRGDTVQFDKYRWNQADKIVGVTSRHHYEAPDHIWLSCLFTWHRASAKTQIRMYEVEYPEAEIHIGGTGFDFELPYGDPNWSKLPDEIENITPDYYLYADSRAVGYCQRGCDRKCQFCVVWRKEGRISENAYTRLVDWVPHDYGKVLLLDNDLALNERWKHDQVLTDSRDMGIKLSLTQGYDLRTLHYSDGDDRAQLLADYKPWDTKFYGRMLYVAWDDIHNERIVREGLTKLLDAGFRGREITCYVLVGHGSTHEQDVYRARTLRNEFGVMTYIMPYNNEVKTEDTANLRRWANFRRLYWKFDFPDYDVHYRKKGVA